MSMFWVGLNDQGQSTLDKDFHQFLPETGEFAVLPSPFAERLIDESTCYLLKVAEPIPWREFEDGHHDGASSFSFILGSYAAKIDLIDRYDLLSEADIYRLINDGSFADRRGLMSGGVRELLIRSLIFKNQLGLIKNLIQTLGIGDSEHRLAVDLERPEVAQLIASEVELQGDPRLNIYLQYESYLDEKNWIFFPETDQYVVTAFLIKGILENREEWLEFLTDKFESTIGEQRSIALMRAALSHPFNPIIEKFVKEKFHPQVYHSPLVREVIAACGETSGLEQYLKEMLDSHPPYNGEVIDFVSPATLNVVLRWVEEGKIESIRRVVGELPDQVRELALCRAAKRGFLGIVRLLITAGTPPNAWSNQPICWANYFDNKPMSRYLRSVGVEDAQFSPEPATLSGINAYGINPYWDF